MDPMTEGMSSYIALAWTKILISLTRRIREMSFDFEFLGKIDFLSETNLACESGDRVVSLLKP
jgi:hypothetical protein